MIPAEVMMQFATLGLTVDQARSVAVMLSAVEAATKAEAEVVIEAGREKARARWHKWNDKQPNVSKRLLTVANVSQQLVGGGERVEDNLPTKKITGSEEGRKKTPRDELAAVLDDEHADAVLEHRQRLRKPLSPHAAHLLALSLAQCPDANAAADVMIESGWLKVKPDWLESKRQQRATAPPSRMSSLLDDIKSGKLDVPDLLNGKSHEPAHPTIDASYERSDSGGSGYPVQVHALSSGRRP